MRLRRPRRETRPSEHERPPVVARVEDVVTRSLTRFLRTRGQQAHFVPYTGIGVTGADGGEGWVRVFGRAMLSRRAGAEVRPSKRRGWRQFFTAPLFEGEVVVTVRGV